MAGRTRSRRAGRIETRSGMGVMNRLRRTRFRGITGKRKPRKPRKIPQALTMGSRLAKAHSIRRMPAASGSPSACGNVPAESFAVVHPDENPEPEHHQATLKNVGTPRIQFVSATPVFVLVAFDCSLAISSSHTSLGVLYPRSFMGVSLVSLTIASSSSCVRSSKLVPLGR